MDRTHWENAEESWIAKYRAALKDAPVEQSRFMRVCVALTSARDTVISQVGRILTRWTQAKRKGPASSSNPAPISEPRNSTREMNRAESSGKPPSKKTTATTWQSKSAKSTSKKRRA
jgi:hypothetical protein